MTRKLHCALTLAVSFSIIILSSCNGNTSKPSFKSISHSNTEKIWTSMFERYDYLYFDTQYSWIGKPIYLALHPYVYSEDGLSGCAYFVRSGDGRCQLCYFGDYEIIGDYIKISDIIEPTDDKPLGSRVYKVSTEDGNISSLRGKVPVYEVGDTRFDEQSDMNFISDGASRVGAEQYLNGIWCMHNI